MSKELEALEKIKKAPTIYVGMGSDIYTRYPTECKQIEKCLKALELIKRKKVNIYRLNLVQKYKDPLYRYNDDFFILKENYLTQKEYNELKETVL